MDTRTALEKLERISKKPKFYFIYHTGESYAHELDKDLNLLDRATVDKNPHIGGVEDVTVIRTSTLHEKSSVEITIEVEDDVILTDKGYLKLNINENNKNLAELNFPYNLESTRFIIDIWDERFRQITGEGI